MGNSNKEDSRFKDLFIQACTRLTRLIMPYKSESAKDLRNYLTTDTSFHDLFYKSLGFKKGHFFSYNGSQYVSTERSDVYKDSTPGFKWVDNHGNKIADDVKANFLDAIQEGFRPEKKQEEWATIRRASEFLLKERTVKKRTVPHTYPVTKYEDDNKVYFLPEGEILTYLFDWFVRTHVFQWEDKEEKKAREDAKVYVHDHEEKIRKKGREALSINPDDKQTIRKSIEWIITVRDGLNVEYQEWQTKEINGRTWVNRDWFLDRSLDRDLLDALVKKPDFIHLVRLATEKMLVNKDTGYLMERKSDYLARLRFNLELENKPDLLPANLVILPLGTFAPAFATEAQDGFFVGDFKNTKVEWEGNKIVTIESLDNIRTLASLLSKPVLAERTRIAVRNEVRMKTLEVKSLYAHLTTHSFNKAFITPIRNLADEFRHREAIFGSKDGENWFTDTIAYLIDFQDKTLTSLFREKAQEEEVFRDFLVAKIIPEELFTRFIDVFFYLKINDLFDSPSFRDWKYREGLKQGGLNELIKNVITGVDASVWSQFIDFEYGVDSTAPVNCGSPERLKMHILNLFENAIDAIDWARPIEYDRGLVKIPGKAKISVRARSEGKRGTLIEVEDDGLAFDPDVLKRLQTFLSKVGKGLIVPGTCEMEEWDDKIEWGMLSSKSGAGMGKAIALAALDLARVGGRIELKTKDLSARDFRPPIEDTRFQKKTFVVSIPYGNNVGIQEKRDVSSG